jgi:ketosteroid isomerase-like protein
MTTQEQNLALTQTWERLYNEDAERMATECYAVDCIATAMGGESIHGNEALRKIEIVVSKAAPNRLLRVDHRHAAGDVVIVEAVLLDPDKGADWQIPFVAVLTIRDGRIALDRTYADWRQWPGFG